MLKNSSIIKSNFIQPNRTFMNELRLFIKSIDGEVFSFSMKNHDLIRNIKIKIYDKIGLNIEEQILCYQGAILKDMRELNYYEIIMDSLIDVVGRLRGGMRIFINLMDRSSIDIEIDNRDKIRILKRKIQEITEIPVNKQQLVYQGSILENNKTIGEYQISEISEIKVVYKLGNDEIKVSAKTSDGKTVEIEVDKSDKIFDLRCEIEWKLRLIENEQKLVYKGVILDDDDKSINEYEICDQSEIEILAKMLIHITTSGGMIATIEMYERDKIKDLKYQIEKKLALNMDKQKLVFEERILDDDNKSIDEYQICDRSVIDIEAKITLLVRTSDEIIRSIEVYKTDNITNLKNEIRENLRLNLDNQNLVFQDKILDDDNKTIDQYQICQKSVINIDSKYGMVLFVQTIDGKTITIVVKKSDKIIEMKEKIQEKIGLHWYEQILIYNGAMLENSERIDQYNICDKSVIIIVARLRYNEIQITVINDNRKTVSILAKKSEKIIDLKKKIQRKLGLCPDKQILIYQDEILNDDEKIIDECQIYDQCVISVVCKIQNTH